MTSVQKGEIAQLKVQQRAVELGYTVSIPTVDCRYDLIIDDNSTLTRAQIKYAAGTTRGKSVRVYLAKNHKNNKLKYKKEEIDIVLVYVPKIDKLLQIKAEQFHDKCNIDIRIEKIEGKTGKYNWYEDHLW